MGFNDILKKLFGNKSDRDMKAVSYTHLTLPTIEP